MFNSFGPGAAGLESALIGLAVLAFFIVRQFSTRSVTSRWAIAAPLVLAFFGLQGLNALDVPGGMPELQRARNPGLSAPSADTLLAGIAPRPT